MSHLVSKPSIAIRIILPIVIVGAIVLLTTSSEEPEDFDSVTVTYNCNLVLKDSKNIPEEVVADCKKMRDEGHPIVNKPVAENIKYI